MPIIVFSFWAVGNLPERLAFDVNPARALCVSIPDAMPAVPIMAEPNMAIVSLPDGELASIVVVAVDLDVLIVLV
jgi:hypothetical protein